MTTVTVRGTVYIYIGVPYRPDFVHVRNLILTSHVPMDDGCLVWQRYFKFIRPEVCQTPNTDTEVRAESVCEAHLCWEWCFRLAVRGVLLAAIPPTGSTPNSMLILLDTWVTAGLLSLTTLKSESLLPLLDITYTFKVARVARQTLLRQRTAIRNKIKDKLVIDTTLR